MNIFLEILGWLMQVLRLRTKKYPPKMWHKTRADFIEKIKKENKK